MLYQISRSHAGLCMKSDGFPNKSFFKFLECCLSAVIYFSHISKPVAKNTHNKKKHARKSFKWLIIMLTVPRFPSGNFSPFLLLALLPVCRVLSMTGLQIDIVVALTFGRSAAKGNTMSRMNWFIWKYYSAWWLHHLDSPRHLNKS